MNFDLLVIPTLVLALLLVRAGIWIFNHTSKSAIRLCFFTASLVLALPAVLIPLYYFHVFDKAKWFYEFRAFPCSELSAAGAGLLVGFIIETISSRWCKIISGTFLVGFLCIGIAIPYLKPVFLPLNPKQFLNNWKQGVCLQSTGSSCGAASTATILKTLGVDVTEAEIAKECYTNIRGTENWFLARAFAKRGFSVRYRIESGFPQNLHLPAIAGVNVGCGHFIAILSETDTTYITGDPLVGRKEYRKADIAKHYHFTGFFMEIGKDPNH